MRSDRGGELLLAETAASDGNPADRAHALLQILRRLVPFDAAWLALTDPLGDGYHTLASVDLGRPTRQSPSDPSMAQDIRATGTDRACSPLSPSYLPHPTEDLRAWADCMKPAGIHQALAVALFAPARRHVGFLGLWSGNRPSPSPAARRRLGRLAPVLAQGVDPMRSLVTASHLVQDATAGAVLHTDGGCEALPGLPGDALLSPRSALLVAAREPIDEGHVYSTFLWPRGGFHAPDGHVRVTVLKAPQDVPLGRLAVALLSPPADLHGLTPRELDVLGLLVEGCSNQEIARTLVVAQRTVATHLEHVLAKLEAPTRTLAAVRAEREGLYVPACARRRSRATRRANTGAAQQGISHGGHSLCGDDARPHTAGG